MTGIMKKSEIHGGIPWKLVLPVLVALGTLSYFSSLPNRVNPKDIPLFPSQKTSENSIITAPTCPFTNCLTEEINLPESDDNFMMNSKKLAIFTENRHYTEKVTIPALIDGSCISNIQRDMAVKFIRSNGSVISDIQEDGSQIERTGANYTYQLQCGNSYFALCTAPDSLEWKPQCN
jgi:hypothetical protein